MRSMLKKLSVPAVFLLVLSLATFANAGPRKKPGHGKGGGGPIHSVAEPASLALLGMGLVSLSLYAKRNKSKE